MVVGVHLQTALLLFSLDQHQPARPHKHTPSATTNVLWSKAAALPVQLGSEMGLAGFGPGVCFVQ